VAGRALNLRGFPLSWLYMLNRDLVLFLIRENYSPCTTALKEKKRGKKKWVKGLDNGGNIEGICIFCV
jgi:hypothetical protein